MNISDIVIATDLSDHSEKAALIGHALSQLFKCPVTIAHAIEVNIPNWFKGAYETLDNEEKCQKTLMKIRTWYNNQVGKDPDHVHISIGDSASRLQEFVETLDNPLLILSKSGLGTISKYFVGSTTKAMVFSGASLTLAVDTQRDLPKMGASIVLATDLTSISRNAFDFAASLARVLGSSIDIVHTSAITASVAELGGPLSPDALHKRALKALSDYVHEHTDALEGITYRTHVIQEQPLRGLSEFTKKNNTDLLIIGHMDRKSYIENLFGRVSVRLLKHSPSSLVVVPGRWEEEVEAES